MGWKRPEIRTVLTESSSYLPGHSTLTGALSEILILQLISFLHRPTRAGLTPLLERHVLSSAEDLWLQRNEQGLTQATVKTGAKVQRNSSSPQRPALASTRCPRLPGREREALLRAPSPPPRDGVMDPGGQAARLPAPRSAKRSPPRASKGGSHGQGGLASPLPYGCPSAEFLPVHSPAPLEVSAVPCWKKKNFPRLPLWLAVSQLSFPSLTVITKPPSKAGFGGVLALPIWSMRLHRRLLRGVTGSTSWPCTKCERQADIYVSAPPGRTLRLFMGKMNFGHEDHYSKCKLTNIFLERLSFFLF